jgi:hypothetical protein
MHYLLTLSHFLRLINQIRWTSTLAEIDGTPQQHRAYRAISGTLPALFGRLLPRQTSPWNLWDSALWASNVSGGSMENVERSNGSLRPIDRYDVGHVQEVIRQAHDELRQLMQQRAEIMKRIGTVKQTISGLANLFGDGVLNEELMELVDRKSNGRQPGFTKACRMILMESGRPMNSRDICDYFQEKLPDLLARHKDPMASVTTVLNRLVEYGEAEAVVSNGRRAWRWVADVPASPSDAGGQVGLVS